MNVTEKKGYTNGGWVGEQCIEDVRLHLKEFLSCVRELDIRVRYKVLNKSANKKNEAFWLKANYVSLMNVLTMMLVLGPLILWWDGGGKGERYIQLVKPHIKRGVRGDLMSFFTRLLEKLFKVSQMELLEKRYSGDTSDSKNQSTDEEELVDILNELAEVFIVDDQDEEEDDDTSDDGSTCSASEAEDHYNVEHKKVQFSALEELGMTKTRTIHVYRNRDSMNEAIDKRKPLAGIVQVTTSEETGETAFEFQIVYRKPVKQFARRKVTFDDANGVSYHGMWCSEMKVDSKEESYPSTVSFKDIQVAAGHSAVAIPLWYVVGKEHANANKYYVITNWWKERMSTGQYELPTLDSSLYNTEEDLEELLRQAATSSTSADTVLVAPVI